VGHDGGARRHAGGQPLLPDDELLLLLRVRGAGRGRAGGVRAADVSLVEARTEQRAAWESRPLLQRLYREWFSELDRLRSPVDGPTIELGSGIGAFAEAVPDVLATDVEATPWAERVVDASALPFADGSVANLVLVDVYHHLVVPAAF